MLSFLSNKEIYDKVICGLVPQTKKRLWIATADIKDMYVAMPERSDMVPFLQVLDMLLARGVDIRLIHAKEPGHNFRQDFDRFPRLWKQMERVLCPRVHFKCIIVDGTKAYFGSANLTGAGLGAKSDMVQCADALIAVIMGQTRGTRNMIQQAQKAGLPVFITEIEAGKEIGK